MLLSSPCCCFYFAMQPMKLGEHLNSLLLNMCDDVTLSRMSLRTVLDICSKHIRNSTCDPPFSYIRKLVRLVLGSLSQVHCSFTQETSLSIFPFKYRVKRLTSAQTTGLLLLEQDLRMDFSRERL